MTDIPHRLGADDDYTEKKRHRFPPLPLFAAITIVGLSLLLALIGKTTDIGTVRAQFGEPIAMRDVLFNQGTDRLAAIDLRSGQVIADMKNEGFVFGVIRGLERVRMTRDVPEGQPYRIIKWENGWVSLSDTGTGERIYINAFGPDNAAAFERILFAERSDS